MRAPKTVIQQMPPPTKVIAEETKLCKKQPSATPYGEQGKLDLATDSWSVYERNELGEPWGLHLTV